MKNETLLTKPSKEPQGIFIVDIPPERTGMIVEIWNV